jgi:hypothetical protein
MNLCFCIHCLNGRLNVEYFIFNECATSQSHCKSDQIYILDYTSDQNLAKKDVYNVRQMKINNIFVLLENHYLISPGTLVSCIRCILNRLHNHTICTVTPLCIPIQSLIR